MFSSLSTHFSPNHPPANAPPPLAVLHPLTSCARQPSSGPLIGELRRVTPPLLRHRPASRAVCPSLDSPADEQRGSAPPLIHQLTTSAVTVVAGAGSRGRSTSAVVVAHGRARGEVDPGRRRRGAGAEELLPPPRTRATEVNPGSCCRVREGSFCRRGQAARGESSRLLFCDFFMLQLLYIGVVTMFLTC
jgi:hypothetical protein